MDSKWENGPFSKLLKKEDMDLKGENVRENVFIYLKGSNDVSCLPLFIACSTVTHCNYLLSSIEIQFHDSR